MSKVEIFLDELNRSYLKLHKKYEDLFWLSNMGDRSVDDKKNKALSNLDNFRSDKNLLDQAKVLHKSANDKLKARLQHWISFFEQYQLPNEAKPLREKINALETEIAKKRSGRTTGYVDPVSGGFVLASELKMRAMIQTNPDEKIRKACFEAREKLALDLIEEYVVLVKLRNEFAQVLGFSDFYDYKLQKIDRMTKGELFSLFEDITEKTKSMFSEIRKMEQDVTGLRKPWNFSYYTTGDFTKEEDSYFQFDQAILRWGISFSALGIDFKQGKLQLDLLDREGKYNNGFCHWPDLVHFDKGKRRSGSANFTCTVVAGQVGSGVIGYNTLFHEGGHAAHFLNCEQKDVCLNHEYAPMTAAWAETQSMFIDTLFSSIEWKMRYAENSNGEYYPFELFKKKVEKLNVLKPARILSIIFIATFEREVYELQNPSTEQIIEIAKRNYQKYYDMSEDSLSALNVPHIYAWESSCSYHGYGLAEIALNQWREYFYKKHGYIVDNPQVGKEMKKVWQLGASRNFRDCVKLVTGKKLSSSALVKQIMLPADKVIKQAKSKLQKMETVKKYTKPVNLQAEIKMVHGKKVVASNKISFEVMAEKYGAWARKMAKLG
ncbi:MAG: M2 family metallopeptidase [Candidatus Pacebacteria bacterium]|nr:M2 family metallopeptidase [Candidatus Paceibacterota bacterium]